LVVQVENLFENVIAFQNVFRAKMYQNDFFFKKIFLRSVHQNDPKHIKNLIFKRKKNEFL
jgi:hypothetical protein